MAAKATRLGIAIHSYSARLGARDEAVPFGDPLAFLDRCHGLGAGGIQVSIGVRDAAYAARLRERAAALGMFIEGQCLLPRDAAGVEKFEAEARAAAAAGASVVRVALGDRRYEQFDSFARFKEFAERSWSSLRLAEPIAARSRVTLAVENHKDFRAAELIASLERLASERVGACVDVGNGIALLEDPIEVVAALAPWARSVHLKDAVVGTYGEGILLGDVPLGDGCLDLARMVRILREARPEANFSLEMITRDPLRVPCLTDRYWDVLPDVPARDLARTLALARARRSGEALPRAGHLAAADRFKLEDANVARCLAYARDRLDL